MDTIGGDDRVRENTEDKINVRLDREMAERVRAFDAVGPDEIGERISELDGEWDIERVLEMNASTLAFTGLVLGMTHSRKWLALPAIVLPFLFQHAVQGWCPPIPVLRRLGFRTRNEIDREKFALKTLRGDFRDSRGPAPTAALRSVTM
jgi:hypothetical protein